jgi:crossover junction endodeoxyribonuclease RuvC
VLAVMRVVGIDPGVTGGLAVLELAADGSVVDVHLERTPAVIVRTGQRRRREYDVLAMWQALCSAVGNADDGALVALERVSTRSGQHAGATLRTGIGFGHWLALAVARGAPVVVVSPEVWKRHHGLIGCDKRASRLLATRRFPLVGPLGPADEGPAEALLLAAYAATRHLPGGLHAPARGHQAAIPTE